jgi:hypothetical protein
MAKYTQNVPARLIGGLRRVVGRYNADQGAELTVAEWLQLHVLEIAVQDELGAEQQRLTEQAQKDVAAGVLALRDRLTAVDEATEGGKP